MSKYVNSRIYKCCEAYEAFKADYVEIQCSLKFKSNSKLFNGVYVNIYTKEGDDGYYNYEPYFETYVTSVRQVKAFLRKHRDFITGNNGGI